MKVLLVCNTAMPEITGLTDYYSGKPESWVVGHIDMLRRQKDVDLTVAFPAIDGQVRYASANGLQYVTYPKEKKIIAYDTGVEEALTGIFRKIQPNLIHVFGTEFPHALAAVNAAEKCGLLQQLVINIQGFVSVIGRYHYEANLPEKELHRKTLRDFLRHDTVLNQKEQFIKRGELEKEAIRKAKNIIGRTEWDRICVRRINPDISYYSCNETLRNAFYTHSWRLDQCQRHSVFVSQSNYPLKGFHVVLEALSELKKDYPDLHIYTTGEDPRKPQSLKRKLMRLGYPTYLAERIKDLGLNDAVTFLGLINEEEMCARFLKSHVFVSASSVENSSNSVGEAMLLGVPTVSSYVGGVVSMMDHRKEGLMFPFDEPYMLAGAVKDIFDSDELAESLSQRARIRASVTHDREKNEENMMSIYRDVVKLPKSEN